MGKQLSKFKYVKTVNAAQAPPYQTRQVNIVSHNDVDQGGPIQHEDKTETPQEELNTVKAEFSRNIFNLYLLCKYKLEMDQTVCRDMACAGIATYIVQFSAAKLLTVIFQGSNGYDTNWKLLPGILKVPIGDEFVPKSLFLWPYIIITLVSVFKETATTWKDLKMFVMVANTTSASRSQRLTIGAVKYGQMAFDSFISFYYIWFIVTVHGDHDDENMLEIILNLFAFEFILQLDEQVYCLFIANLRMWSTIDPQKLDDAFQGTYWTTETSPVLRKFQFFLLISSSLVIISFYAGSFLAYRITFGVTSIILLIIIGMVAMDFRRTAKILSTRKKAFESGSKALFQYDFWGIEDTAF